MHVTLEKVADALRTEGQIAGQITQAVTQAKQNIAAVDKMEAEALDALGRAMGPNDQWRQATETVCALAKGVRDNATACAKAAEGQMALLEQRKNISKALMDALKPAIAGKRGADFGRRVVKAFEAFTG